jgi:TPR repeat protein
MRLSGPRSSRLLLCCLLLGGVASGCAPSWTPQGGTPATEFNIPLQAKLAFERARLSEKSGDNYGARMNYDMAAASGHPKVLLFEARYYLRGPDNRDPLKARAALEQAVLVESPWKGDAQFLLGKMLVRGDDGVEVEADRGEALLQAAADAGVAPAAAELARTLERSGSDDSARIDALWAVAAEGGDENAIVRSAERQIAQGKTRAEISDLATQAMMSLNERAEEGDVNAMRSLAKIYGEGTLAPADKELSLAWLERAVNAGDAQSATRLARALRDSGRTEERIDLLTQAAEAGDPLGAGRLATIYLEGNGVPKDIAQAEKWAAVAIEGGDTLTMARFGRAYVEGQGVAKDVPRGLQLLEQADAEGSTLASAYLARIYLRAEDVRPDPKKAALYADKAVAADYAWIKAAYGRALLDGKNVRRDRKRGIELLREAAGAGDGLASTELGVAYLQGNGVPRNVGEAIPLLRAGAESGNASAMNWLARTLLDEKSPHYDQAGGIQMLQQAADAGHPAAQAELGERRLTGDGVAADPAAGLAMLTAAADGGNSGAMMALGRAYLEGTGVAADPARARAWLTKAKAAGRGDADKLIAQLPAA